MGCFTSRLTHTLPFKSKASTSSSLVASSTTDSTSHGENDAVVRSPMRFLGPYPTMPLRFPNLATPSQRERNVTGISLDWVLDTAANTNTINAAVALELGLESIRQTESKHSIGAGNRKSNRKRGDERRRI